MQLKYATEANPLDVGLFTTFCEKSVLYDHEGFGSECLSRS